MSGFVLALAGAALLWLPAYRFRVDVASCAAGWPTPAMGALWGVTVAAGVALLTAGWLLVERSVGRQRWTLRRVLLLGAVLHALALVAPPFLSMDPLYYCAVGRSLHLGGDPFTPLSRTLSAHDPIWLALPLEWRDGISPYWWGFNQLSRLLAVVGGTHLDLQLRLYQLLGASAVLLSAWLAGLAAGAEAAALLLFCPLAVVDGTINPHNDALLMLGASGFVLATVRRRDGTGVLVAASGLLVKASALLLLGFDLLRLALERVASRVRPRTLALVALAVAAVGALALWAIHDQPMFDAVGKLLGDPRDPYPHFTRSLEALPRAFLTYVVGARTASWALGLVFRAGAAVWLLYAAWRAAVEKQPLRWAAIALFVYYLFLHAYMESWYLLPLLPLAPFVPAALNRPLRAFLVGLTAYYALALPLDCDHSPVMVGAKEFLEGSIVILTPLVMLLLTWRRQARARASVETAPRAA